MTTYFESVQAQKREKERANPYLDLSRQVLVPVSNYEEDTADALRTRELLLQWSSGTPFWGSDPAAYEHVRFAKNIILPGICKISGRGFEQRLQRDKPAGTHGHSVKQLGIHPCKVQIEVRMWTPEHLQDFERLIPLLLAQKYKTEVRAEAVYTERRADLFADETTNRSTLLGSFGFTPAASLNRPGTDTATQTRTVTVAAGPQAVDVYHPMLALFKIRSVHIASVSIPEPTGDGDVWQARIECEQFINKPVAVKAADKSLEIVPENPRVGQTAFDIERAKKKPSERTKGGGNASGNW